MDRPRAKRRSRSHFGKRRRRSILFAGGSAAAALLASAFTAADFAGVNIAAAAVERAKGFLELMSQRSPGQRVKGALVKTKHRRYRVLAERSPAPELPIPPLTGNLADLIAPPSELPGGIESPPLAFAPPTELPRGVTLLPPPGGIVCCGVGPSPPPPEPPPPPGPPPPPPPPPAVPEPGTWMTMMLGFGLTGWMLRRRRAPEGERQQF